MPLREAAARADSEVQEVSRKQRRLTVKVCGASSRTAEQTAALNDKRKEVLKEVRTRVQLLYTRRVGELAEEVGRVGPLGQCMNVPGVRRKADRSKD